MQDSSLAQISLRIATVSPSTYYKYCIKFEWRTDCWSSPSVAFASIPSHDSHHMPFCPPPRTTLGELKARAQNSHGGTRERKRRRRRRRSGTLVRMPTDDNERRGRDAHVWTWKRGNFALVLSHPLSVTFCSHWYLFWFDFEPTTSGGSYCSHFFHNGSSLFLICHFRKLPREIVDLAHFSLQSKHIIKRKSDEPKWPNGAGFKCLVVKRCGAAWKSKWLEWGKFVIIT